MYLPLGIFLLLLLAAGLYICYRQHQVPKEQEQADKAYYSDGGTPRLTNAQYYLAEYGTTYDSVFCDTFPLIDLINLHNYLLTQDPRFRYVTLPQLYRATLEYYPNDTNLSDSSNYPLFRDWLFKQHIQED